ncbi:MAG TPA: TonB-dependent receptor plug domain-containing protein, partial [Longimicrobiaceae bacterium]|nr:TonB-dependent receptor plug domain-containing protein [Longimicrobiaceae bacterium]
AGVPAGRWRLRAERIGYAAAEAAVSLGAGQDRAVELRLTGSAAVEVEGIEVRSTRDTQRERARFETEAGVTTRVVSGAELKVLPGLAEADVLRAVEVLPGVVTTSDFSSAFHVRGGSADQNLILLDGFPIFNPFHLGGLFSVFNSDVVARAELLAGGFGAEYGGRVSSVLNVETRDDADGRIAGDAGVSLLASRLALRAALPGLPGGAGGMAYVSARRSYFDVLLPEPVRFPYHLTDVQGGAVLGTPGGGTLRVTGYTGRDVLDLSDFDPPGADADAGDVLRIRWNWGNDVVGARWSQPVGAWVADTRLGYSSFGETLGFVDFADTRFSSRIRQVTARADLGRELSPALGVRLGVEGNRLAYQNVSRAGGTEFFFAEDDGILGAGYGQLRWRPGERWIVEPGLRADVWRAQETTHALLSPRLAVKRFFGRERDGAVKLALGRYTQFLHSLRDESFPLSNDTWIVADASIPAVVSDQAQLGVERFWGDDWYASAEAYFRRFEGVTAINFADDPNDAADDLLAGDARSYGLDFMLRRTTGRLRGWAAVSLLRARQTLPDAIARGWGEEGATETYAPVYDRRLDVDLVLQYDLPWGVEAGARWNFGSGIPYTRPLGQYMDWDYDLGTGEYRVNRRGTQGEDGRPPFAVVLGPRNGERYPAYHRLDATLRRTYKARWGTATPYLQVLNVYNQRNPLFYFYNFDNTPATRSGISMFPVLPTIGLEVSF